MDVSLKLNKVSAGDTLKLAPIPIEGAHNENNIVKIENSQ
jgi:hypothetical protein